MNIKELLAMEVVGGAANDPVYEPMKHKYSRLQQKIAGRGRVTKRLRKGSKRWGRKPTGGQRNV